MRMGWVAAGWREAFGVRELAPAFSPARAKSAGKPPHSKRFALREPINILRSAVLVPGR